ncbi:MAG: hypothetical protein ABIS29_08035 [Vicinamibacterales bacterium]
MSVIPPQGFRHAATLLLTNSVREIPAHATPEAMRTELERLTHELVALAGDTRAPAQASDWLIEAFNTTIERLPQRFDREAAKSAGAAVLARVGSRAPVVDTRDLFLVYVSEDRLTIAAPLAVELAKRRVSIAFADYEVATAQQFSEAMAHGIAHHRGGVVLHTRAFDRTQWPPPPAHSRIRVLRQPQDSTVVSDLAAWATQLRAGTAFK